MDFNKRLNEKKSIKDKLEDMYEEIGEAACEVEKYRVSDTGYYDSIKKAFCAKYKIRPEQLSEIVNNYKKYKENKVLQKQNIEKYKKNSGQYDSNLSTEDKYGLSLAQGDSIRAIRGTKAEMDKYVNIVKNSALRKVIEQITPSDFIKGGMPSEAYTKQWGAIQQNMPYEMDSTYLQQVSKGKYPNVVDNEFLEGIFNEFGEAKEINGVPRYGIIIDNAINMINEIQNENDKKISYNMNWLSTFCLNYKNKELKEIWAKPDNIFKRAFKNIKEKFRKIFKKDQPLMLNEGNNNIINQEGQNTQQFDFFRALQPENNQNYQNHNNNLNNPYKSRTSNETPIRRRNQDDGMER